MSVNEKTVEMKMKELANLLNYGYRDLSHIKTAMRVDRIDSTAKTSYSNSSLATVGDAVLKAILAERFYRKGFSRGDITLYKSFIESNESLHAISEMKGLHHYAYNSEYFFDEAPGHSRLPSGAHDVYLEAVIGAVFHDLGFDRCSEWVENTILPLMFRNDVDRNTKDCEPGWTHLPRFGDRIFVFVT